MIYVLAFSTLKPGCREEFIRLAKANIPIVHQEAGCISYELSEDFPSGLTAQKNMGKDTLVFVECWESGDHLKAHLASPHMKAFSAAVAPLRESSSLHVVTPV